MDGLLGLARAAAPRSEENLGRLRSTLPTYADVRMLKKHRMLPLTLDEDALPRLTGGVRELFPLRGDHTEQHLAAFAQKAPEEDGRLCTVFTCTGRVAFPREHFGYLHVFFVGFDGSVECSQMCHKDQRRIT